MQFKKIAAVTSAAVLTVTLAACSSSDSGSSTSGSSQGKSNELITAYGCEPQNGLIGANTNEVCGGRVVQNIFSGLYYYDADGKPELDMAKSVDRVNETTYKVTLKDDITFSDGSAVKAENFVKAWNLAVEQGYLSASFFEPIKGYAEGAKEMEGLKIVDDKTFTIELNEPHSDFVLRLGYSAFQPLPDVAFTDPEAFGQNPVGNGPYKLSSWNHDQDLTMVPNESYKGSQTVKNAGVKFVFYPKLDAAYADLLSDNLDVIDTIPSASMASFRDDLKDRAVQQPSAVFQGFTIPAKLAHFGEDEEGKLRRQAISLSINRQEVVDKIFASTREPAKDFTSPVIDGWSGNVAGSEVLEYNPTKAKELWAKADAISPWSGQFAIAYNADGGHQDWVDAVTNSIRNTLGIDAVGKPYPDFKSFRTEITNRQITTAFRSGWQADYPALGNFLIPNYSTGGSSNDGDYSNPEFDAKMLAAEAAPTVEEAAKIYDEGQTILFTDLPGIPLWYGTASGGHSQKVANVKFGWDSQPIYTQITKG